LRETIRNDWALHLISEGEIDLEQQAGRGSSGACSLWIAVDGDNVYVQRLSLIRRVPSEGGMAALQLAMGTTRFVTPTRLCENETLKHPPRRQSPRSVRVFSGTMDGQLLAYSAQDRQNLWQFNSVRDYPSERGKANEVR